MPDPTFDLDGTLLRHTTVSLLLAEHFGQAATRPCRAALMTFLETQTMNRRFHEAEAVLLADPSSGAF